MQTSPGVALTLTNFELKMRPITQISSQFADILVFSISQIFSKIVILRFLELSANSDELSGKCQTSNTTGLAKGRATRDQTDVRQISAVRAR